VVTVTLPEETLERLAAIDGDRARAIVRAAELADAAFSGGAPAVEMQAVSPRTAVITVPESPALASLRGLRLIQIRPSRYLIVLDRGMALAEVEITLLDALEALPSGDSRDRTILSELLYSLRSSRRSDRATTGELILVDI
jgi:hypothetical protein